jgi:hypothetical protein
MKLGSVKFLENLLIDPPDFFAYRQTHGRNYYTGAPQSCERVIRSCYY